MTIRSLATALTLSAALAANALAQTTPTSRTPVAPAAPVAPSAPVAPRAPEAPQAPKAPEAPQMLRRGQPVNIRVDITITDQNAGGAPSAKKTVSVVTADGMNGRIRSSASYEKLPPTPLNVDAEPEILSDGKIRVRVNLQYVLPGNVGATHQPDIAAAGPLRLTDIQENLSLVLENGKPLIAAQSADPVGDRQVTIEVKATVLR